MKKAHILFLFIFLILLLLVAGCQNASNLGSPAHTDTADLPSTQTPPSEPAKPLVTPTRVVPTASLAPTQTPAVTPAASTITSTPLINHAKLVAHGALPDWQYLLTFEFENEVEQEYILKVDGNKNYACYTIAEKPTTLFCHGQLVGVDKTFSYKLLDTQQSLVLAGEFYIPYYLPED